MTSYPEIPTEHAIEEHLVLISDRNQLFHYQPWQFFASSKRDCIERFGQRTIERINNDDDVICTTEYSRIVPLENGEVVVSLVNGRPGAMNFSYSPVLREFTKATHIRLRFLRTNTLLGHLMGKALRDPTVTRRYYYSIKDISIGGRCVCNGHAEACNAEDPNDPYKLLCDCQHNTCGVSCDQCCPGYNQLPWRPATTYSANECEREYGLILCTDSHTPAYMEEPVLVLTHTHTHIISDPSRGMCFLSCVGSTELVGLNLLKLNRHMGCSAAPTVASHTHIRRVSLENALWF
ncbi:laminin subunit alpha-5-like [Micropterus salmoides]|uniref:laminin subunit alpha-5-like n=1 Tax=Micropterus salmoides TaxID=27706 RepID=UPI0018EB11A7|nr:laminin subunit alpha-5-like [Micropterus salmoides]